MDAVTADVYMARLRTNQSGFTLFELFVVLASILILVTLVILFRR